MIGDRYVKRGLVGQDTVSFQAECWKIVARLSVCWVRLARLPCR